ncbi:glycosyltransferase family 4 protein [Pedobacter psychrotolerans]|uniref:glycosyltransferase family 4 protein n=1 Tax=Pedobacter psychrotolerans TaxID=1843235 RepID=UPI003F9724AC
MKSLAIIVTHPIQYYVPVYQQLAKTCHLKVFYTWGEQGATSKYDPGFKKHIQWDIPLLDGYDFEFLKNTSKNPGSHHYKGIINPQLIESIKAFQPDAILIYGWAYQSHLTVLRYFKGKIPLWFRGDSTLLDKNAGLKQLLRNLFLKWVYRHVDQAFFVGSANQAYFLRFGLQNRQLVFAPHAIDNSRFAADRSDEALLLRKKLGIDQDALVILFAGKLEKKKNPELLLHAFIDLNINNVHLLFVGNGELETVLKQRIESLETDNTDTINSPLHTKIHFIDFQNQTDMPVVYQACDLFCLPSQGPGETWGLAVNEAMAAGKAILVSDRVGSAKDLISEGINGNIFISGDLTDLKNKLLILTADREQLSAMGQVSKEMIQNWTFKHQVNALIKTLHEGH